MNLFELRKNLLEEAKSSPNLLSDLAGLESYVAESYNNRSFIELLQNADDAGATKFKIIRDGDFLFVANNGKAFDEQDMESLCRSASSHKTRGETIGYRGIGFKSVVGFAKEIHLLSGQYEITFSKEKTKIEIPGATKVPLIRIPHLIDTEIKVLISSIIEKLYSENYNTIFIFSGVVAQEINLEFDSFNSSSLMFLKNVCETEFCISEISKTKLTKKQITNSETKLTIENESNTFEWLLQYSKKCVLAYLLKENKVQRIPESEAIVYAFLPTENITGLGIYINGDFSTDPSRKHIIYDGRTNETIKSCCHFILTTLEEKIINYSLENLEIATALIPINDPRMLQFKKKSFDKMLLEGIKDLNSIYFNNLRICPNWLNVNDYINLLQKKQISTINSKYYEIEGFIQFVKYLGAKEDTFQNLSNEIDTSILSILGCAQFIVQFFKLLISKNIDNNNKLFTLALIMTTENERVSFISLKDNHSMIDSSFISLIIENGLTEFEIKSILKQYISVEYSEKQFPLNSENIIKSSSEEKENSYTNLFLNSKTELISPAKGSIARWRSAEEITLEILNQNGFKLEDVSKQNIGYDLEGLAPNGKVIQIEVKSITFPGQQFRITNNEIAVAQEKQESYHIAIVRLLNNYVEIALISNPIKNLKLNRQCVQWIWECSEYDYLPAKFNL